MSEWMLPLAGAALLLSLLSLVAMALLYQRGQRQLGQQRSLQETMQGDLRALVNAAVQVGERINRAERQLKQLQQRQESMVPLEPDARSFEQAIKLARKGAGVEELMDICELSRGEAELIAMMHRLDRPL